MTTRSWTSLQTTVSIRDDLIGNKVTIIIDIRADYVIDVIVHDHFV